MHLCINPKCSYTDELSNVENSICPQCGSFLLLEGRYWVTSLVSEEGFGKIYEVDDRGTTKLMKVLLINDVQGISLFQREAAVLSQLSHPGIPKIEADGYFTILPEGRPSPLHCLVLEKVSGINLQDWLSTQPQPLSQIQAIAWLKYLVEILDQVHHHLYFHRDLQPSNIILTPEGRLVMINFGCGREIFHNYLVKTEGGMVPTFQDKDYGNVPGYTPPEQIRGRAVPQSDYFSLGRTFVYLLTGKSPQDFMEDPRTGELLWQHRSPQISPGFSDVIDYLMATLPGNRPHNAQMILMRLSTLDYAPPEPSRDVGTSTSSSSSSSSGATELSMGSGRSTERALLRARAVKRRQQFNYGNLWQRKSRQQKHLRIPKAIMIILVSGVIASLTLLLIGMITETITPDWVYNLERQLIWQREEVEGGTGK